MSSVDRRLLDNRWTQPFGETDKTELLKVYAAIGRELNTDAWMFGKNTVCAVFLKNRTKGIHPSPEPLLFSWESGTPRECLSCLIPTATYSLPPPPCVAIISSWF